MAPHKEGPLSDPVPLEPGIDVDDVAVTMKKLKFPSPPTFDNPHEERDYLKGRLAAAFRIFGYAIELTPEHVTHD